MARPASKHPTELELEILKIIWRIGPATGRQVRDALEGFRDLALTSVLTILNVMTRKRYLKRRQGEGGYVYSARVTEQSTIGRILGDLVDRVFNGSTSALMLNLLKTKSMDPDELKHLRELIDRETREQS